MWRALKPTVVSRLVLRLDHLASSDLEQVGANVVVEDLSDPAPLTRIIDELTT